MSDRPIGGHQDRQPSSFLIAKPDGLIKNPLSGNKNKQFFSPFPGC
jgi:hypothetical protein